MDGGQHLAHFRVDVDPRSGRVVELDAEHGERRLAAARVVIGIVVGEHLGLHDRHVRERGLQTCDQGPGIERLPPELERPCVDEDTIPLDAAGDVVGLMKALAPPDRLRVLGGQPHHVVVLVLDPGQVDLLDRAAAEHLGPALGLHGAERRRIDRPPGERLARHVESGGIGPRERLHGQQTAEGECQREEPEDNAGDVMPAHPS
jgi:hypothetical protein